MFFNISTLTRTMLAFDVAQELFLRLPNLRVDVTGYAYTGPDGVESGARVTFQTGAALDDAFTAFDVLRGAYAFKCAWLEIGPDEETAIYARLTGDEPPFPYAGCITEHPLWAHHVKHYELEPTTLQAGPSAYTARPTTEPGAILGRTSPHGDPLREALGTIDRFEKTCQESESTDTGVAWEVLEEVRKLIRAAS